MKKWSRDDPEKSLISTLDVLRCIFEKHIQIKIPRFPSISYWEKIALDCQFSTWMKCEMKNIIDFWWLFLDMKIVSMTFEITIDQNYLSIHEILSGYLYDWQSQFTDWWGLCEESCHRSHYTKSRIMIMGDSRHLRKLHPCTRVQSRRVRCEIGPSVTSMSAHLRERVDWYRHFKGRVTSVSVSLLLQVQACNALHLPRPRDRWCSWKKLSCDGTMRWVQIVSILREAPSACKFWFDKQTVCTERATELELSRNSETDRMEETKRTLPRDDVMNDQWLRAASSRNARWTVWIDSTLFRTLNGVMTNHLGTPMCPCVRRETSDDKDEDWESRTDVKRKGSNTTEQSQCPVRTDTDLIVEIELTRERDVGPSTLSAEQVTTPTRKCEINSSQTAETITLKFRAERNASEHISTEKEPRTGDWQVLCASPWDRLHEQTVSTDHQVIEIVAPWKRGREDNSEATIDSHNWWQISLETYFLRDHDAETDNHDDRFPMSNVERKSSSLFPMTDDVERCQQVHGGLRQDDQIVSVQLVAEAEVWTRAQSDIRLSATYGRWMQFHQEIDWQRRESTRPHVTQCLTKNGSLRHQSGLWIRGHRGHSQWHVLETCGRKLLLSNNCRRTLRMFTDAQNVQDDSGRSWRTWLESQDEGSASQRKTFCSLSNRSEMWGAIRGADETWTLNTQDIREIGRHWSGLVGSGRVFQWNTSLKNFNGMTRHQGRSTLNAECGRQSCTAAESWHQARDRKSSETKNGASKGIQNWRREWDHRSKMRWCQKSQRDSWRWRWKIQSMNTIVICRAHEEIEWGPRYLTVTRTCSTTCDLKVVRTQTRRFLMWNCLMLCSHVCQNSRHECRLERWKDIRLKEKRT